MSAQAALFLLQLWVLGILQVIAINLGTKYRAFPYVVGVLSTAISGLLVALVIALVMDTPAVWMDGFVIGAMALAGASGATYYQIGTHKK